MTRRAALPAVVEWATIAALLALWLASFGPRSPVHGPAEVFAQDSPYLLESLAQDVRYPWNPQSHLLHHVIVELGYSAWRGVFGSGLESAYRYLKLFAALSGLAFLVALRWLLRDLGLDPARRIPMLALAGLSVSAWFHFAAFEAHCLAMPALAVYLASLVRLRNRTERGFADRALLVGSLVAMAWLRVDLLRFAAVSVLLPFLPGLRRFRRSLIVDLALIAALAVGGNTVIASLYFGVPLPVAATAVLHRDDRPALAGELGQAGNLTPAHLVTVGRAVTTYSLVMPVERRPPGRSFFASPVVTVDLSFEGDEDRPSTTLFLQPAHHALGYALPLVAFTAVTALLVIAVAASVRRAFRCVPLHVVLIAQALAGWLFYTWFNPLEPFLWIVEFLPLWLVMIAELLPGRGRVAWASVGAVAALVGAHNFFAFYLPLR